MVSIHFTQVSTFMTLCRNFDLLNIWLFVKNAFYKSVNWFNSSFGETCLQFKRVLILHILIHWTNETVFCILPLIVFSLNLSRRVIGFSTALHMIINLICIVILFWDSKKLKRYAYDTGFLGMRVNFFERN